MDFQRDGQNDDVRSAIFRAGVMLFARKGYFATTIRDIVERAGVTQPMVYYYFGNKEKLFIACVRELDQEYAPKLEAIDPNQPFKNFIIEMIGVLAEMYRTLPEVPILLTQILHTPDEYPQFPEKVQLITKTLQLVQIALENAKKRGEIAANIDPLVFGVTFFGAMEFMAALNFMNRDNELPLKLPLENFLEQLQNMLLNGIHKK